MQSQRFFNPDLETMERGDLQALIDERITYTIQYAAEHSPFYRSFFREKNIRPADIKSHEDLLELPIITGQVMRENQPPITDDFLFRSQDWNKIYTIHETSGTSGTPKSFFLTWQDWKRYATKYSRIFISQGFSENDRLIVCASYGMNVGANTMTVAARDIGMTIIPTGKCTFPIRLLKSYRPTGIVGSVFKFIRLARRMRAEGMSPEDSTLQRLVIGGESFADESRRYVQDLFDCEVYNTYGSTEGTMCGECNVVAGLHVPEDIAHMDIYDYERHQYVKDGDPGHIVLTTLLKPGEHSGTLLINYDTDDTTSVLSRSRCACGRTHMRILNPWREAETIRIFEMPINRIHIERAVFQQENMTELTGEYEAFVYGDEDNEITLRISVEAENKERCDVQGITSVITENLFKQIPNLADAFSEGILHIPIQVTGPGGLELHHIRGRPKRLVDRR
ncbi:MAG TPA: coenzyme F390 synthetase [Methanospirillum sp.]|nr:coenzyme F390 synthetase [Methanospirillum sp.]